MKLVLAAHMPLGVASGSVTIFKKCLFALLQEVAVNAERLQEEARRHAAATSALHQSCQQLQEQLAAQAAVNHAVERQVCLKLDPSLAGQATRCFGVLAHAKTPWCSVHVYGRSLTSTRPVLQSKEQCNLHAVIRQTASLRCVHLNTASINFVLNWLSNTAVANQDLQLQSESRAAAMSIVTVECQ